MLALYALANLVLGGTFASICLFLAPGPIPWRLLLFLIPAACLGSGISMFSRALGYEYDRRFCLANAVHALMAIVLLWYFWMDSYLSAPRSCFGAHVRFGLCELAFAETLYGTHWLAAMLLLVNGLLQAAAARCVFGNRLLILLGLAGLPWFFVPCFVVRFGSGTDRPRPAETPPSLPLRFGDSSALNILP